MSSSSFDLYPAIDLLGGRCVRLYQGDYDRETVYGDDPVAQARRFAAAGAPWVHVVDLDAARSGEPVNRPLVAAVAAALDVPVQTGGGVRSVEAARALADAGVGRVVVGTAALGDPAVVAEMAAHVPVAVGLDVRGREVAVRGWEEGSGRHVLDVLTDLAAAPVAAFVVTQITRDGTLEGPDLALLAEVVAATEVPVVASGGVGGVADIAALRELRSAGRRLAGVIVGRALYEGAFTIEDALAAAQGEM
jgi:phosphoribosylformimino-5-aminoimidazole carboxamide ribotide isomerase